MENAVEGGELRVKRERKVKESGREDGRREGGGGKQGEG